MTLDAVKDMTDGELDQVIAWAQEEQRVRAERKKKDTIAKIRALAGEVGISVSIAGTRGRPKGGSKIAVTPVGEQTVPNKLPTPQGR